MKGKFCCILYIVVFVRVIICVDSPVCPQLVERSPFFDGIPLGILVNTVVKQGGNTTIIFL